MSDPFDFGRIQLGLQKPETAADVEEQATFNGMRKAIERAGYRDSALIRNCLETARVMGLSGEDTYVLLAYKALLFLESTHQQLSKVIMLNPNPPLMIDRATVGKKEPQSTQGE